MRRGFTLVELLLVLAIVGVLSSLAFRSGGGLRERTRVAASAEEIAGLIAKAQNNTQAGLSGLAYGVRVNATSTALFAGASYSPGAVIEFYEAPLNVTLAVTPAGDLLFDRLTGALALGATTTVTVTGPDTVRQIIVGPNGLVSVQ